ncbi:MAG TPA: hypothetical protein VMC85_17795 [Desulfomonilaceae bacterium]|nr:hypothetical protein [Desulfomonilaceae bacterium]
MSSPSGEAFQVEFFRPECAEGIVRLFRAVYGDSYPIKLFYDANALTEANISGECYSIIARNPKREVIGVTHLFRSAPYKNLYEVAAGLVLKEYRQIGVNKSMLDFIYEEWAPGQENIEEVFGEAVCNHIYMQKTVLDAVHVETALEVALMPAEAYDKEKSSTGRVAGLLIFRPYGSKPHKVYLPSDYEDELKFLYAGLDDIREMSSSQESLPRNESSRAQMTVFDFAGVARIAVEQIGEDFARYLDGLENKALNQKAVVIQVWLKLAVPAVSAAVSILRKKGYFLGGLLPRWFDHDGILMQKLLCPPDFDGIRLYSDRAHQILDIVKEDWLRAQAEQG